jgi:hypothetical protein
VIGQRAHGISQFLPAYMANDGALTSAANLKFLSVSP